MGMGDLPTGAVEEAQGWGCPGPVPLQVRGPFGVRQPRALRPRKQAAWPGLYFPTTPCPRHMHCDPDLSFLYPSAPHIINHALLACMTAALLSHNFLEKKEKGLPKDRWQLSRYVEEHRA